MSDIIHLLPDSIANQIAAGEVIQRPASVVKELVENSIDAGATCIKVYIKDAGKTLIRVIDDGKGMSEMDARLSFERHATSKIQTAEDLFQLRTMGFRGEALASIAAVAQVELRTRRPEDEIGTMVSVAASEVLEQTPVSTPVGTDFQVKNLFYNTPVRRKFLKAPATELRHVMTCFQRIALVYPDIAFELYHNDNEIYVLKPTNLRQRIMGIFGKKVSNALLEVQEENELVKISGFVGTPESAKHKDSYAYFFVNGRYMNHPYFNKAVTQAFDRMLPSETKPNYFIYFDVPADTIDVNVHPTKTEIKFENENMIWPILVSTIKETLGKFNVMPVMSFDSEMEIINNFQPTQDFVQPTLHYNSDYNPFEESFKMSMGASSWQSAGRSGGAIPSGGTTGGSNLRNWDKLYAGLESMVAIPDVPEMTNEQPKLDLDLSENHLTLFQFKKKYIVSPTDKGLMLIDQRRAHIRILFEQNMKRISTKDNRSQTLLFPETFELNPALLPLLHYVMEDLKSLGFDIEEMEGMVRVSAVPIELAGESAMEVIIGILEDERDLDSEALKSEMHERVALALAKSTALRSGNELTQEEMEKLYNLLFDTENPNYTPDGKVIMCIFALDEIERRFNSL